MNAIETIEMQEEGTLYKKKGRKYVPVNDVWAYEGLRDGWWLVGVNQNGSGKTMRRLVFPAEAEQQAAIKKNADKILDIIREASEARPAPNRLSAEAEKDLKVWQDKHKKEMAYFEYPSLQDMAEKIITELTK